MIWDNRNFKFQSTLPVRGATDNIETPMDGGSEFQSTLPVRGATVPVPVSGDPQEISIHAPREGSDGATGRGAGQLPISIHAPREGSDELRPDAIRYAYISIHAPREGSDFFMMSSMSSQEKFQSTLPVRGATVSAYGGCGMKIISIHAPREGSDFSSRARARFPAISIHAPREGSDLAIWMICSSMGRISIHAPREGSDPPDSITMSRG